MLDLLETARTALADVAVDFDGASLSRDGALRVVDELGAIRRAVDGMLAKAAKRVAQTSANERDATTWIARSLGVGTGEVRTAIETATKLEHLPATDSAVRAGRVSAREAQMIAEAATVNPEAEEQLLGTAKWGLLPLKDACIAARAAVEDPEARAKRQHAQREWRTWTNTDGMVAGRFQLTPEVGGLVKAAIDAQVQRIFRNRTGGTGHEPLHAYAADAFAGFVLGENPGGAVSGGVDATVHVIVDHGALVRGGAVGGEVCEIPGVGPVDVAWARELLGAAFVTAVIKRGKDILTVAHFGRHIPAEVRTALLVSGRECDVEACSQRGYLERDHVYGYARGGATSFANLGWLCSSHHRLKSSGWQLGPRDPETRKRKLRPPPARAA